MAAAVETIRRDDFGDEDPLWPETRAALDGALAEAQRFRDAWASANATPLRVPLRAALGLAPYPRPGEGPIDEPAPLPAEAPDVEWAVGFLREWAETA